VLWLPKVEELEQEEELLCTSRNKVITSFTRKERHTVLTLTSLITQYVTKKPTTTAINATIMLHGITHSKELVDSFYKLGMGISYPNVLLCDIWTTHDLEQCYVCSDEINEGSQISVLLTMMTFQMTQ